MAIWSRDSILLIYDPSVYIIQLLSDSSNEKRKKLKLEPHTRI